MPVILQVCHNILPAKKLMRKGEKKKLKGMHIHVTFLNIFMHVPRRDYLNAQFQRRLIHLNDVVD